MDIKLIVPRPVSELWPIVAPFGAVDPKWWPTGPHRGTDFATPIGTPVHSVWDGSTLQILKNDELLGNCLIVLSHDYEIGTFIHRYSHLLAIDDAVLAKGSTVKAGQLIGTSGKSGRVQGPHLDFALKTWPGREPIEPIFI